jgi:hypothetical protein
LEITLVKYHHCLEVRHLRFFRDSLHHSLEEHPIQVHHYCLILLNFLQTPIPHCLKEPDYLVVEILNRASQVVEHLAFLEIVLSPQISVKANYLDLSQVKITKKTKPRNRRSKLTQKLPMTNRKPLQISQLDLEDSLHQLIFRHHQSATQVHLVFKTILLFQAQINCLVTFLHLRQR